MSLANALNPWPNLILSCKIQMFPFDLPVDELTTYDLKFHDGYVLLQVSTIKKSIAGFKKEQGLPLPKQVLRIRTVGSVCFSASWIRIRIH
jgi:hypothetical protein